MLELLDGTEQYNNAGALIGLNGPEGEELLGALRKMHPVARQNKINQLANPVAISRGSRGEMEKHFSELPAHCSQSYYNFYKSLKNYSGVGISFPPPAEPTIMYTNVNGGFGCFGAYTRSMLRYKKK